MPRTYDSVCWREQTQIEFKQRIKQLCAKAEHQNRITPEHKEKLIQILNRSCGKPLNKKEGSFQRNIRDAFMWHRHKNQLRYFGRQYAYRRPFKAVGYRVITTNKLLRIIERVHARKGHAGIVPTFHALDKKYYGIR
jgi:hypothetical protein